MKYMIAITIFLSIYTAGFSVAGNGTNDNSDKMNFVGTSVLSLLSFIPDASGYYYGLDYGRKLDDRAACIFGFGIFKYAAPMSLPWSDTNSYPGYVLSSGIVIGYQRLVWDKFFVMPIINPLIVNYYDKNNSLITSGFMLLLCLRAGYHFDLEFFKQPFYLEIGAEVNYWPINTNEPENFSKIENKYNPVVISPALNFGYKF